MKDPTDRKTMDLLATATGKERPILFSGAMVRAILDGKKTQTRRVLKTQLLDVIPMKGEKAGIEWVGLKEREPEPKGLVFRCRYGVPGDRLWVRETWAHDGPDLATVKARNEDALAGGVTYGPYYRATEVAPETLRWIPSIHMPRWACRLVLEVTGVRVERLQKITEADAVAEGMSATAGLQGDDDLTVNEIMHASDAATGRLGSMPAPIARYALLWDTINGSRGLAWSTNPWVWVVEFKRVF